ncbi:hypothetical protein AAFF_G00318790 [Aldrovandia affinis]|uniref:Uncharacterized protein n=1 Tax=Aldrovandia affinis TaxID=143900 RepID=A0AAD7SMM9_9TELE|nr:hypothetical protein AAFF_G00318790 [Aldrovandia affinis]
MEEMEELRSREEELKRAALEQKSHEEFLRQREQQLAQWEQDVFERELSLLILHMNQDKPNVKKRKGTFKKHKLKGKNGEKISMPQDFIHKITVQASPGLEKRKNSPDLGSGSSPSFGPRFRAIQLSPSQNSRTFGLSPVWPLEPLPSKLPNGERRLGTSRAPQSPKSPKSPKVLRLSPLESSLSMRAKLLELDSSENGHLPTDFEEYRPPTPQSTQNGFSVKEPPRTSLPQGDSASEEGGSPTDSPRPKRGSLGVSLKITHRALLDGGSLLASVALGRCIEAQPKVPPRSHHLHLETEQPYRLEGPAQASPIVDDLITFSQSDSLPQIPLDMTLQPPEIRPVPLTPPPPHPRHCHGSPRESAGERAPQTNGDLWRGGSDRRRRSSHGQLSSQLVLDLPICSHNSPEQDSLTPPLFTLFPDPRLWSPKTRRLEVNVIPRPRPSPIRPRIDPWSFISAGGAGRGTGRNAAKAGGPLCHPLGHQPSPTNPFTNCDPFPTPDCDPFAQRVDPFGTPETPSPFDPFSAPFRTSRSAPCSTNVSPSLSALRVAPLSPADPPLIDLGWRGGSPPLDTKEKRVQGRTLVTSLSPWKSPTQLTNDRF